MTFTWLPPDNAARNIFKPDGILPKEKLMKTKFVILFFLVLSAAASAAPRVWAQTDGGDPENLSAQIVALEAKDIDDFAPSVKKIYKENLLYLYREYVSALNGQIELLKDIPDPKGDFAKQRAKFVKSRTETQEKIDILEKNAGLTADGKKEAKPKPVAAVEEPETGALGTAGGGGGKKKPADGAKKKDEKDESKCDVAAVASQTNAFTAAPPALTDAARIAAARVVEEIAAQEEETPLEAAVGAYQDIFAFTLARSIENEKDTKSAIVNLEPLRYLPETYRTDKQIGASSSAAASTSAIDKPGFAALLGFAIENGFVERNVQDTVLTLSTSPAALLGLREKNFFDAYQNAGFLNRFGLSASFNINSDNPLLENAKRSQLREYSARFRFLGDRSANSKKLQETWETKIAPAIKKQLLAENRITALIDNTKTLQEFRDCTRKAFAKAFNEKIATKAFQDLATDKKQEDLMNFYLNFMKAAVYDRVQSGSFALTDADRAGLRDRVKNLLDVQGKFPNDIIKAELDKFFRRPTGTFAYINHRDPLGNFSEFKMLLDTADTLLKPLKLTANAGFSFYHRPNAMLKQKKIRDFSFAVSFEGKSDSPFAEEGDLSQVTYSFTGRYERLFENEKLANRKADLLTAQFLVNFPVFRGFILPFSVSYSNATELERKRGLRVNFGLKLDTDKLFALNQYKKFF